MQILVTDATGTVGRLVARQLIAAGHTVSGIAERPHDCLDPAGRLRLRAAESTRSCKTWPMKPTR